jgi:hypothetical protein
LGEVLKVLKLVEAEGLFSRNGIPGGSGASNGGVAVKEREATDP